MRITDSLDMHARTCIDARGCRYWILALGAVGMSLGLFLYGYKIIRAIGVKLCKVTPSRGTSIELAAALVIIFGSCVPHLASIDQLIKCADSFFECTLLFE